MMYLMLFWQLEVILHSLKVGLFALFLSVLIRHQCDLFRVPSAARGHLSNVGQHCIAVPAGTVSEPALDAIRVDWSD